MPDFTKALSAPVGTNGIATDSKTNATATATKAAPGVGNCLLVTGLVISASAAPATAIQAAVKSGANTLFTIQVPANAFAPIMKDFGNHPLQMNENEAAILTVPALGSAVVCDIALFTVAASV